MSKNGPKLITWFPKSRCIMIKRMLLLLFGTSGCHFGAESMEID